MSNVEASSLKNGAVVDCFDRKQIEGSNSCLSSVQNAGVQSENPGTKEKRRHGTTRNANVELLRIIAMSMVTMLHALGQGGLLADVTVHLPVTGWMAWALESFSIAAVNIFMLISGYFLVSSRFKIGRLADIVGQIMFYSIGGSIAGYLLGTERFHVHDFHDYANCILPIQMNAYWFMTVYVAIYFLLPIMTTGLWSLSKRQHAQIILLFLLLDCFFKSIMPFRLHDGKGYSFQWCLTVFIIGAYFRIHGFRIVNSAIRGWILYVVSSLCIFGETICLKYVSGHYGILGEIVGASMDYNHIFVLAAAIGIFSAFVHAKPMDAKLGRVICALSPMALGVYLLQENMTIRYAWQYWFRLPWALSGSLGALLIKLWVAVCGMMVAGMVVDYTRIKLFDKILKKWSRQRNRHS